MAAWYSCVRYCRAALECEDNAKKSQISSWAVLEKDEQDSEPAVVAARKVVAEMSKEPGTRAACLDATLDAIQAKAGAAAAARLVGALMSPHEITPLELEAALSPPGGTGGAVGNAAPERAEEETAGALEAAHLLEAFLTRDCLVRDAGLLLADDAWVAATARYVLPQIPGLGASDLTEVVRAACAHLQDTRAVSSWRAEAAQPPLEILLDGVGGNLAPSAEYWAGLERQAFLRDDKRFRALDRARKGGKAAVFGEHSESAAFFAQLSVRSPSFVGGGAGGGGGG
ncbi:hypothetical protein T484DRAFT_1882292, partial [Baffinella frigidus]